MPEYSYDTLGADDGSNYSSDWGGAEGEASTGPKQTKISFKQFAKLMGLPNYSVFNMQKKAWVAGIP